MRLGEALGLPQPTMWNLYYALLLKDVGCSNNAARMTSIVGGDDRRVKAVAKLADWTKPHRPEMRIVRALWTSVLPGTGVSRRAARLARIALTQRSNNRVMIELRCERGAEIVRKLELGDAAACAVRALDEHWDGKGYPDRLTGQQIPLLARICSVAQNLDVFAMEDGPDSALAVLRGRSGTWFDPELVRIAGRLHASGKLWTQCSFGDSADETRRAVLAIDAGESTTLPAGRIDLVCEAFASVVDAKSPYTYRHSTSVANIASGLAREMHLAPERVQTVRRAALLHDIGKLYVPNTILDKEGALTREEWAVVREHPGLTHSILGRVGAFGELAVIAAEHHERLDGSGYPHGLRAKDTSLESRLIAMSDQFAAMIEVRPYHPGYAPEEALARMPAFVPGKLDGVCLEALEAMVRKGAADLPVASDCRICATGHLRCRLADSDFYLGQATTVPHAR